ncbi:hypothetical protein F2Q69_00020958 [Brassica cretica]|uniref:Uncharacterized protein n=1 Tax=Brassica cretica TaxID=69181 RepID=A0A8S9QCH4_BRACR|nr:hypothetical protein F2Q69_00020958 [Brassica cretica]
MSEYSSELVGLSWTDSEKASGLVIRDKRMAGSVTGSVTEQLSGRPDKSVKTVG